MADMTIVEWLQIGYSNGWCTVPMCASHDGLPTTAEEDQQIHYLYEDPCVFVARIGDDLPLEEIEMNNSATKWRKNDWGIGDHQ